MIVKTDNPPPGDKEKKAILTPTTHLLHFQDSAAHLYIIRCGQATMSDLGKSGSGFEPSIPYHQPMPSQGRQARGSIDLILEALRENLEPKFDTRRSSDLPDRRRRESVAANRISLTISRLSEDMQERYACWLLIFCGVYSVN